MWHTYILDIHMPGTKFVTKVNHIYTFTKAQIHGSERQDHNQQLKRSAMTPPSHAGPSVLSPVVQTKVRYEEPPVNRATQINTVPSTPSHN